MSACTNLYANSNEDADIFEEETTFEVLRLETQEKFSKSQCITCGEVQLRVSDFHLVFICGFCDEQTEKLEHFLKHSLEHHLFVKRDKIQTLIKEQTTIELAVPTQVTPTPPPPTLVDEMLSERDIKEEIKREDYEDNEMHFDDLIYAQSCSSGAEEEEERDIELDNVEAELAAITEAQPVVKKNIEIVVEQLKTDEEAQNVQNAAAAADDVDVTDKDYEEMDTIMSQMQQDEDNNQLPDKKKSRRRQKKQYRQGANGFFSCHLCGKEYKRKAVLQAHLNRHNNVKPYACDMCDKRFVDATNFKVHRNRHLGIKPFLCNFCGKGFTYSTELQSHLRFHTKEKPYQCDFCQKRYATHSHLSNHRKYHTNYRPHACETCDKRFYDKDTLRRHMTMHSTERPYSCNLCSGRFKHPKYLASHMKVHSGIKHKCEHCTAEYTQSWGLTQHIKRHHPGVAAAMAKAQINLEQVEEEIVDEMHDEMALQIVDSQDEEVI